MVGLRRATLATDRTETALEPEAGHASKSCSRPGNQFTAGAECKEELSVVFSSDHMATPSIVIPDDTLINEISDTLETGVGAVFCILESPSGGLLRSVLPE